MWLQIDWLLGYFGANRTEAIGAYKRFVAVGVGADSPIKNIRHQLLLGDDAFVTTYRSARSVDLLNEVPREHRRALALSLAECQAKFADRDEAIAQACLSTAYTMTQIAAHFHISYRTVSRIVHKMEHLQSRSCAIGGTDPE
ncbi:hypothetical protein GJ697_00620 [Pseudoduganella sp. FT25W]|uniref:Insertion element IS150 protein InsJ-like helix-turn-helix domain-containing protein n=1 Tax=Duganella alba TaxID=2666081 RepID=A0A6L5QAK0_9BURK|nr:helix-turn-helix domain-containing protein [Duganella alba]MRX06332.1 hypothetical protein [Duganella alba]MRX14726.1 hypothetical protein [Duganella alba]